MAVVHRTRFAVIALVVSLAANAVAGSVHRGQVTFNGLPVPGATVAAVRDGKKVSTVTDQQGLYSFPDLADGPWTMAVQMSGFALSTQDVVVAPDAPAATWELKLLPLDQITAEVQPPIAARSAPAPQPAAAASPQPAATAPPKTQTSATPASDDDDRAADGMLINGTMNNGASSPFAQAAAFGNNRFGGRHLYNGGLGFILDNSALDARPYSLAGQSTSKAAYNRLTGVFTLGGPLRIPHVLKNGPNFFVGYQWTRNNNATNQSALMPTADERNGVFSSPILDPTTAAPFSSNAIPPFRISSQARALLNLYPLPNVAGNARYNYQAPIVSPTHQDALQSRFNKTLGRTNQLFGAFAFQSTRNSNPNVFGFLDTTDALGLNTNANWTHRINNGLFLTLGYQFSRMATHVRPFFQNRENVSGEAGILGNNQDPMNWGPPALAFSSGIAGLSDAQSSFNRNQTSVFSYSMLWTHRNHNVAFGADFRRREFNSLAQQDPRGSFSFTGAQTGDPFADFLLGVPSTVSIAFGNADKYFRESLYDAYLADDWKLHSTLTLNAGLRWEYGAPLTELHDRLVNLDVVPGFAAASAVVAANPVGALTGTRYPNSLVRPDKRGLAPRIGLAWKPVPGSSLVVRSGYGIYYDTSVYQTIAGEMAQQPPLSKTLSIQNAGSSPLTLANGFTASGSATRNTFAVDPNFRVGYAQNWFLTVQRDLPAALQLAATYTGIKGTSGVQAFLPNTFPVGASNPCPACPAGFVFLASGGNSSRQSGQVQLRRRLHSGFAGSLQYTFSKSIDDTAALGGLGTSSSGGASQGSPTTVTFASPSLAIAQNWRDLRAERGLSTFDQRHLLSLQMQYTTGMGLAGGTLLGGWAGALLKDWTVSTQVSAGSGLPQTPIFIAPVPGTAFTETLRPNTTGAPLYSAPPGLFLNPAAYAVATPGQWGDAGRGSITGPSQFSLNGSLARTFRVKDRYSLDLRVDSTNALNHVAYTAWNTTINSAQFGLPVAANAMRTTQTTLRLRF